jgi:hypothetical protein
MTGEIINRNQTWRARLFNLATVLSLPLCAAIALLWVRSYWVGDNWFRDAYGLDSGRVFHKALFIRSSGGGLALARRVYTNSDPGLVAAWRRTRFAGLPLTWRTDPSVAYPAGGPLLPTLSWWTRSGFGLSIERAKSSGYFSESGFALVVPDWSLLIATALLPFAWLTRLGMVARRKAMEGRCRRCGYDLRATPDRCPECGTQVARRARQPGRARLPPSRSLIEIRGSAGASPSPAVGRLANNGC